MDCCVCSSAAMVFRLPRNSICLSCYEGAKCMLAFMDDQEKEGCSASAVKGLSKAFRWVKEMEEMEKGLKKKVEFLGGLVEALTEALHTDILVQPGGGGDPIPAHRALLAARSEIFKAMLASDVCKAPPSAAISLPEFNRDQLQCFLQFLYQGTITEEDASKHVFSLFQAADKYDIPFLKSFCERQLLGALSAANALDILEVSAACGGEAVKRKAMETIVEHAEDVLFSSHYDRFAPNNAHLCVEITRMLLKGRLDKRASAACEASSQ